MAQHQPIYMNINNNQIKGESADKNFQGQVELLSFSCDAKHQINTKMGNSGSRSGGRPEYSPVVIKKFLDSASTQLMQNFGKGQSIPEIVISIANNSNEGTIYHTCTLKNVLIASHKMAYGENNAHFNGEDHHRPVEVYELDWSSKEDKYTPYDDTNKAGSPSTVTVNRQTGDVS